jgi:hypothetical protein
VEAQQMRAMRVVEATFSLKQEVMCISNIAEELEDQFNLQAE